MKSEERHELAENDLGKMIERWRLSYADLIEVHGNRILLWAAALVLLLVALIFYYRTAGLANREGWAALSEASSPEDLATVAEVYRGSAVGHWAQLRMGEAYLRNGVQLLFTDREAAPADLQEARTAFEDLVDRPQVSSRIKERAMFGLARTLESLAEDDLEPVTNAYERLLKEFPTTPYKSLVENRLARLKQTDTQEFYAWFAQQKPKLEDRETPSDFNFPGLEGLVPEGDSPAMPPEPGQDSPFDPPGSQPGPPLSVPSAPDFPPTGAGKPDTTTPEPASDTPAPKPPEAEKKPEPEPQPEAPTEPKPEPEPNSETKPESQPTPAPEGTTSDTPSSSAPTGTASDEPN